VNLGLVTVGRAGLPFSHPAILIQTNDLKTYWTSKQNWAMMFVDLGMISFVPSPECVRAALCF